MELRQTPGNALDVLRQGRHERLDRYLVQTPIPCPPETMKLFGLGKQPFNRPLAPDHLADERRGLLAFADPIDLMLVRTPVHESCTVAGVLRQTADPLRTVATVSACNPVALD